MCVVYVLFSRIRVTRAKIDAKINNFIIIRKFSSKKYNKILEL